MTLADDILTDIATMTDTDEHGVAATYSSKRYASIHGKTGSAKSTTVNGIFGSDFDAINNMETPVPVFDCATADVSDVSHGAKLTINGAVYTVRGVQKDGTGMVRLILEAP